MRWRIRVPELAATGLCALLAGACGVGRNTSERTQVMVFAAASLRDLAAELEQGFASDQHRHPVEVVYNFAGSNTLAQQIRAAPGADVLLSADEQWIDFLEQAGRTVAGTRRVFLSNSLVLIARRDAELEIGHPRELASAVAPEAGRRNNVRFLALADPQAVPAGRYARNALERIPWNERSLWSVLGAKIAPALDVRAALALVESDPEIAGIVYKTDAMTSDKVRVIYQFPVVADAPIHYSAVLIAGGPNPELGRRYLDFLITQPALAIAQRHGFSPPAPRNPDLRSGFLGPAPPLR